MNNFTVTEARNALMKHYEEFDDPYVARKTIYRQILLLIRKGWLKHTGKGHGKRYQKTELFMQQSFEPKEDPLERKGASSELQASAVNSFNVLRSEKNRYEGELAIILGEVEEYQSLIERFPNKQDFFFPMFIDAKDRSAKLLGRINALSTVLKTSELEFAARC
ncbi:hypothetical protein AB6E04_00805 [Vibrio amylolyticus]|uniref:hypothetical protein n=1 Tax=Vibrio amylolyticus TaxID=2847292 RepID=UPI003552FAC6